MDISVIVCVYNGEKTIRQSLTSLVVSADKAFGLEIEIIVVDNNSTDETNNIVNEFCQEYNFISYIKEVKQGLSYSRNTGLNKSSGDYVAYIDDDARVGIKYFEVLTKLIQDHKDKNIACYGGVIKPWYLNRKPSWFKDDLETRTWGHKNKILEGDLAKFGFSGSNMIFRKRILKSIGGFPTDMGMLGDKIRMGEDAYVFFKLFNVGYKFYYCKELVVSHLVEKKHFSPIYTSNRYFGIGSAASKIKGDHQIELHANRIYYYKEMLKVYKMIAKFYIARDKTGMFKKIRSKSYSIGSRFIF
jgi:glycosyltransferase involved in cell wall biosynthesis